MKTLPEAPTEETMNHIENIVEREFANGTYSTTFGPGPKNSKKGYSKDQLLALLQEVTEEYRKDVERFAWWIKNPHGITEITAGCWGYLQTTPDAKWETWSEHIGWLPSSFPATHEPFETVSEAIDAAIAAEGK